MTTHNPARIYAAWQNHVSPKYLTIYKDTIFCPALDYNEQAAGRAQMPFLAFKWVTTFENLPHKMVWAGFITSFHFYLDHSTVYSCTPSFILVVFQYCPAACWADIMNKPLWAPLFKWVISNGTVHRVLLSMFFYICEQIANVCHICLAIKLIVRIAKWKYICVKMTCWGKKFKSLPNILSLEIYKSCARFFLQKGYFMSYFPQIVCLVFYVSK